MGLRSYRMIRLAEPQSLPVQSLFMSQCFYPRNVVQGNELSHGRQNLAAVMSCNYVTVPLELIEQRQRGRER